MNTKEMNPFIFALILAFLYYIFFILFNYFFFNNIDYRTPFIGAIIFSTAYIVMDKILKIRIEKKIKK